MEKIMWDDRLINYFNQKICELFMLKKLLFFLMKNNEDEWNVYREWPSFISP